MSKAKVRVAGLAVVVLATLAWTVAASAGGPEVTRFSFSDSYVDTGTCPTIPIETQLTGRVSIKEFSGTRVQIHQQFVYEGSANGKRFTDNETFTKFVNPQTGVEKFAGAPCSTSRSRATGIFSSTRECSLRLLHGPAHRPPRRRPPSLVPRRVRSALRLPARVSG